MLRTRQSILPCFLFSLILLLIFCAGGCKSKESYKKEVESRGVVYSRDSFQTEIIAGNKETVELFIKAGINVNDRDPVSGMTALMFAIAKGHDEIIKLLLDNGADVNVDAHGTTALTGAVAAERNIAVIKMLLDKGANVNYIANPESGMTALMFAAFKGHADIVKILLDKGADVNATGKDGMTALRMALLSDKSFAVIKMLLDKGASVNNINTQDGVTALMIATSNLHADIVEMLIVKGADVNAKADEGMTALMYASLKGSPEIVKMLIDKGADLNAKRSDDLTALKYASNGSHDDVVALLKKAGAAQ